MSTAVVYRHYDDADRLLYVGCTSDPIRRERSRRSSGEGAAWIDRIARTEYDGYSSRDTALAAEADQIAALNPLHNVIGKPRPAAPLPAETEWFTTAQAADLLGVHRRTICHRIKAGTLTATKLGPGTAAYVISRAEIERVKAEKRKAAAS